MKKILFLLALIVSIASCKKDEDPPVPVEASAVTPTTNPVTPISSIVDDTLWFGVGHNHGGSFTDLETPIIIVEGDTLTKIFSFNPNIIDGIPIEDLIGYIIPDSTKNKMKCGDTDIRVKIIINNYHSESYRDYVTGLLLFYKDFDGDNTQEAQYDYLLNSNIGAVNPLYYINNQIVLDYTDQFRLKLVCT